MLTTSEVGALLRLDASRACNGKENGNYYIEGFGSWSFARGGLHAV